MHRDTFITPACLRPRENASRECPRPRRRENDPILLDLKSFRALIFTSLSRYIIPIHLRMPRAGWSRLEVRSLLDLNLLSQLSIFLLLSSGQTVTSVIIITTTMISGCPFGLGWRFKQHHWLLLLSLISHPTRLLCNHHHHPFDNQQSCKM